MYNNKLYVHRNKLPKAVFGFRNLQLGYTIALQGVPQSFAQSRIISTKNSVQTEHEFQVLKKIYKIKKK